MFRDLFKPHIHLASFVLRLGLAIIMIYHGCLKMALDNGASWHEWLNEGLQLAVTWGELICGGALFLGLLSRLAVVGVVVIQIGAIYLQTARWDFVNTDNIPAHREWAPTGYEYNVALIVMCLTILALGSGKVSLDYLFFGSKEAYTPPPA